MTTTDESLAVSFRAGFAGDVFVPGDHGYAEARTVWNGTVTTQPALVARCHSSADIAAAVNLTRAAGCRLPCGRAGTAWAACRRARVVSSSI